MKKEDTMRRKMKALRILRGLDQHQLARAVGLKQPEISYYETGRRNPDQLIANHIARILGTTLKDLFPELAEE